MHKSHNAAGASPASGNYTWEDLLQLHEEIQQRAARYVESLFTERDFLEHNVGLLTSILQSVGDGLIVLNEAGEILLYNHAAEAIIGCSLEGLTAEDVIAQFPLFLPDKQTPLPDERRPMQSALAGVPTGLTAFVPASGSRPEKWVRIHATPVRDRAGTTHGAVAVFHDTTREHEFADRLDDLYNHAPCGYHSVNGDGVIIEINDTELEWLEYSRDEVIGRLDFADMLPAEFKPVYEEKHRSLIAGGAVSEVPLSLVSRSGATRPVLWSSTAVTSSTGRFLMTRSALFDVSEQTLLIEQRNVLAAIITHDLKNHLIGECKLVELIHSGAYGDVPDSQKPLLQLLKSGSESQLQRINNMVEIYRYEVGSRVLQFETVDLAPHILAWLDESLQELQSHGLSYTLDLSSTLQPVSVDTTALRHVFLNLLGNAIRFTPEGGHVRVASRNGIGHITITVADTGAGIPPSELEVLFKTARKSHMSHKPVGSTGLGLYLCKRLLDAHGANIDCQSEEGKGTVFTVTIPEGTL